MSDSLDYEELCLHVWLEYGLDHLYDYEEFKRRYKKGLDNMMIHESEIREEIAECKNELNELIGNADKAQYQELKKRIKSLEKELRKTRSKHERTDEDEFY